MARYDRPLVLLEFNEVNFDFVRRYIARGHLKTLGGLIASGSYCETTSEDKYELLEPWIQWVTAHTGLPFSEHGVFRLGDITTAQLEQIWETLEAQGICVAAVSPINASNRTRNSPFFIPDPWTRTQVSGGWILRQLHSALAQAVGDNAQQRMTAGTGMRLALALLVHFRASTIGELCTHVVRRSAEPWRGALFLDRFLADVFVTRWRRSRPGFASLFLNAAAHIQHHYMFSSAVYEGPLRNPSWYPGAHADPVLDAYRVYDGILGDVLNLPGSPRVMIATGLHQDPHPREQYYYRLRDHEKFLTKLSLPFVSVHARMSRDFTIYCGSAAAARHCETVLSELRAPDQESLFSVDNRGSDLFVMLAYPREIGEGFLFTRNAQPLWDLSTDVVFVALKNGEHNGIGYLLDSSAQPDSARQRVPLAEVYHRVCNAMGVTPSRAPTRAQTQAA